MTEDYNRIWFQFKATSSFLYNEYCGWKIAANNTQVSNDHRSTEP